jgi:predicted transcriptional regulator
MTIEKKESMDRVRDLEVVRALAASAAQVAAETLANTMRKEMQAEHNKLANHFREELVSHETRIRLETIATIQREIRAYHGDMTASQHVLSHARMDRLVDIVDRISSNAWGTLLSGLVKGSVIVFLAAYFIYNAGVSKLTGGSE